MTGWIPLIATRIQDALGNLLSSGSLEVLPTDSKDRPISAAAGGLGGALSMVGGSIPVVNGALSGGAVVPDTSVTSPTNICLRFTIRNAQGDAIYVLRLVQTNGMQSLNLDQYAGTPGSYLPLYFQGPQGPAGSPGNFGPTVKTASQIGCTTDGTDCGPLITSFFASAAANSPKILLLDTPGKITVSRIALSPNGHCSIIGMGDSTGFILKSGSNQSVIGLNAAVGDGTNSAAVQVYDPGTRGTSGYTPVAAPTIAAQNVYLVDFAIDGNRANNTAYFFGIDLVSCKYIRIHNVTLDHVSKYSVRLGNVQQVKISSCRFRPFLETEAVTPTNTDGLHINGPASNIAVSDCYFRTGDDAIALNCPEGYTGNITNVAISNCVFDGSQTAVRLYADSSNAYQTGLLSNVTITNLTGTVNVAAFVVGLESARSLAVLEAIRNITISNVSITAQRFMLVSDHIASLAVDGCTWSEATPNAVGMFQAWFNAVTISNLSVRNCRLMRDSLGNSQSYVIDSVSMNAGGSFKILQLNIHGFSIEDVGSGTTTKDYPGLSMLNLNTSSFVSQINTSGNTLRFGNLLLVNGSAATPAQYKALISTVSSTDLLHMASIPDQLAYIGTMYYSTDASNALSINNNGTAKRL